MAFMTPLTVYFQYILALVFFIRYFTNQDTICQIIYGAYQFLMEQQKYTAKITGLNSVQTKYVIVGGGLSAFQAALILAEHKEDFVILQASNRIGGRICTSTVGKALEDCYDCNFPWLWDEKIKNITIQCGATWISENQPFMNYYMKKYGLTMFPQNDEGKHALGIDKKEFHYMDSLGDFYSQYRVQILKLFQTIKKLTDQISILTEKKVTGEISPQMENQLSSIFNTYDAMSAYDFIKKEVNDQELTKLLANQIETLQCVDCHRFTAIQLFVDDSQSSLANVRFYIGEQAANIDGFRVQEGLTSLLIKMKEELQSIFDKQGSNKNVDDVIKLNSPVKEIKNHQIPVTVLTEKGQVYKCSKAILCLPVGTMGLIQFSSLSIGKKLIIQNQLTSNMTRMSMIFKRPWWRPENTGYASFSHNFHMNELVDLTPKDQSCGIIAFVFTADGFAKWNQSILEECGGVEGVELKKKYYEINQQKCLHIVADVYLKGQVQHDNLKEVAIFWKSLSANPYIKSTYDATTGPGVYKSIFEKNLDFNEAHQGQEENMIILGSDFSDEFCGYMQGAVRIARKKIYALCGSNDPLIYLKAES